KRIEKYMDWFDLLHPETPFMQIKGTKASESTPIQKIYVGLPEGNNHAFFNQVGEVNSLSLPEVAVAMFNQNANAPNFSGKQKAGLRGAAPINTLILGDSLRQTIWCNVLHKKNVDLYYPSVDDKPVWVESIVDLSGLDDYIKRTKSKKNAHLRKTVYAKKVGLIRGLFWLPVLMELIPTYSEDDNKWSVSSFKIGSDFYFEVEGSWPHPHSPRKWSLEKDDKTKKAEYFLSFTTTAPAWTQLSSFLIKKDSDEEGTTPAAVISQYHKIFRGKQLNLIIGGYRNKQALILQRRHELFCLKKGWQGGLSQLNLLVNIGLDCKKIVRTKLYSVGKEIGVKGLADTGERQFYNQSESLIHNLMKMINWDRNDESQITNCKNALKKITRNIFTEVVTPYEHDPKFVKKIIKARSSFNKALALI
ncbi:MAG: type I-E CRISPR-associated protein Cse1/CasA, partial [Thermodesulfovibrionia bacterium]|nr:type I-E CRISPR-associated protein Cse1/CasA [Thermodesulfovibrionia bacterium]